MSIEEALTKAIKDGQDNGLLLPDIPEDEIQDWVEAQVARWSSTPAQVTNIILSCCADPQPTEHIRDGSWYCYTCDAEIDRP